MFHYATDMPMSAAVDLLFAGSPELQSFLVNNKEGELGQVLCANAGKERFSDTRFWVVL